MVPLDWASAMDATGSTSANAAIDGDDQAKSCESHRLLLLDQTETGGFKRGHYSDFWTIVNERGAPRPPADRAGAGGPSLAGPGRRGRRPDRPGPARSGRARPTDPGRPPVGGRRSASPGCSLLDQRPPQEHERSGVVLHEADGGREWAGGRSARCRRGRSLPPPGAPQEGYGVLGPALKQVEEAQPSQAGRRSGQEVEVAPERGFRLGVPRPDQQQGPEVEVGDGVVGPQLDGPAQVHLGLVQAALDPARPS